MKKLFCIFLMISLLFSLCACSGTGDNPTDPSNNNTQNGNQQTGIGDDKSEAAMVAVSVPAVTEESTTDDGTVLFRYTYQNMSLVLHNPQAADKIIVDFLNRVDSSRTPAQMTAESAKTSYNGSKNWTPYLYHLTYSPTRIDSKVLSLFGNNVVSTGAGHPERTCVSASYDLLTGDVLTLASVMNMGASSDDFCKLVLDGLTEMAEGDYLYEGYANTVKQRFTTDTSQDEAWYFTQTGMCFYFAPYEIAPYSSGVITVEIPYEKLKELLHEAYLPAESEVAKGSVAKTPFDATNLTDFSNIAEIIAEKNGKMYILSSKDGVQDVRIIVTDTAGSYTVFAANALNPGDGIMLQTGDKLLQQMKLTYKSGGDTVSTSLYQ